MQNNPTPLPRKSRKNLHPLIQDIVDARTSQRLTQQELAEIAGVSRRTIVLVEAGGDCTLGTLRRIATGLGLEIRAHKPHLPTLEDVTRENEMIFANRHSPDGQ